MALASGALDDLDADASNPVAQVVDQVECDVDQGLITSQIESKSEQRRT